MSDARPSTSPYRGPKLSSGAQRAFASLYRELAKIGVAPPAVARCKVWQVAAMLGVGWEDEPTGVRGGSSSMDLIRQRVAAERGEGPAPEAEAPSQQEVEDMMNAFSMPST